MNNSVNLKLIEGGYRIKRGDKASLLLLFIGATVAMLLKGLSSEAALVGIYSAWISTGIHSTQSGVKKLYKEEK